MNIIMASDNRGVDMMLVAMYSILHNNKDLKVDFFVINTDITPQNKHRILQLKKYFPNLSVKFLSVDPRDFDGIEVTSKTVTMAAYYRYLAPELLPNESKALYMDIDMMCLGDLTDLYNTDLKKYYIGAVEDFFVSSTSDYPGFKEGIGFSPDEKYVNSGLILMNLTHLRESGIMNEFWRNVRNKSKIIPAKFNIFADQTVTNITFRNKIKYLQSKYNVLVSSIKYTKQKNAIIVHFAGPDKPFTYRDEHSFQYNDIYYDYYDKCMSIVGGNGNQMIKDTIKRLGREATEAMVGRSDLERILNHKSRHVKELTAQLNEISKKFEHTNRQLNEAHIEIHRLTSSISWRLTAPLRKLNKIKTKLLTHN